MFAATTPKNAPIAYRASTSANPNPVISPAFIGLISDSGALGIRNWAIFVLEADRRQMLDSIFGCAGIA
ncbi:hypothetical protein Tco_0747986 [Tanacetum coccineum]|uniref:Uncharacterized protein n=1 Tax=Tanacetum coccineum TaxID=301880 RepID=A0ABQ4YWW7_9ASTR